MILRSAQRPFERLIRRPTSDQDALRAVAANDAALCTIVGIDGTYSRRLGAQLAVGSDGMMRGSLADGCLETELAHQAASARDEGRPRLLRYGAGSPIIDFRLPCGSGLDIWIDPYPDRGAAQAAVSQLDARHAASLSIGLHIERDGLLGKRHYIPDLRLVVIGRGPEHDALCAHARFFGCEVHERLASGTAGGVSLGRAPQDIEVDPWTAIVLLFHDHAWEDALLDWALATQAFYIGAQGGAATRDERIAALRARGHAEAALKRVRSPVGLIPHTREAEILALSILADLVAGHGELHPHR